MSDTAGGGNTVVAESIEQTCEMEETKPSKDGGCCNPDVESQKCGKQSLKEAPEVDESGACKDECCASEAEHTKPVDTTCTDGCCSAPPQEKPEDVPSCCEGKRSPCCDSTCIDRLALRECKSGKIISGSASGKFFRTNLSFLYVITTLSL